MKKYAFRLFTFAAYLTSLLAGFKAFRFVNSYIKQVYVEFWKPYLNSDNFSIIIILWQTLNALIFVTTISFFWIIAALLVRYIYNTIYET